MTNTSKPDTNPTIPTSPTSQDPEKWYALYIGKIVGPYDSEKEAWTDCGGDVEWIKLGKDLK
jgi:hypothetical protein